MKIDNGIRKSKIGKFLFKKSFLIGLSFLLGLALGYFLGLVKAHHLVLKILPKLLFDISWLDWLSKLIPEQAFLSDIAAVEGVLIGVSIPIALQVVNKTADRYRDQEIAKIFIHELLYKIQYILFLSNIIAVVFLRFINVKDLLIFSIVFFWFVLNVFCFFKFILLVERYATDTDKLLIEKLKAYVKNIIEE